MRTIKFTFALALMLLTSPILGQAQQVTSLTALSQGKGTMVASKLDSFKVTGVLVLLKENGEAQITLYTSIQIQSLGHWTATKDPHVINLTMSAGVAGDDQSIKGTLTLRDDLKTIAGLTARGQGVSGANYEVNFVADEKP
jgi:hypothetical protein